MNDRNTCCDQNLLEKNNVIIIKLPTEQKICNFPLISIMPSLFFNYCLFSQSTKNRPFWLGLQHINLIGNSNQVSANIILLWINTMLVMDIQSWLKVCSMLTSVALMTILFYKAVSIIILIYHRNIVWSINKSGSQPTEHSYSSKTYHCHKENCTATDRQMYAVLH
jgi:hypothetical protein